jgi:hypothetical protein
MKQATIIVIYENNSSVIYLHADKWQRWASTAFSRLENGIDGHRQRFPDWKMALTGIDSVFLIGKWH